MLSSTRPARRSVSATILRASASSVVMSLAAFSVALSAAAAAVSRPASLTSSASRLVQQQMYRWELGPETPPQSREPALALQLTFIQFMRK